MTLTKIYQHHQDPIQQGQQNGRFRYVFGTVPISQTIPNYNLDLLISKANVQLEHLGRELSYQDHRRVDFDTVQLVKINLLYHNLLRQNNIKPWLLAQRAAGYQIINGESRFRAMELLDNVPAIQALVCVPCDLYNSMQPINNFYEFAEACQVPIGTAFWFTMAEPNLDYGLSWYEVALDNNSGTTGGGFRDWAQRAIQSYLHQQPDNFRFDRDWFRGHYDWASHAGSNF